MTKLKSPYPWFGGKSRCAHLVWDRFGDVPNYVEPFFGSGAVLLGRPTPARTETINDRDCFVANFWRAVTADPEAVTRWADGPINEADLHARHRWLVAQADFRVRMLADPDYFDAKIAGWWVWGISQWIGGGWCVRPEWTGRSLPGRSSRGLHRKRNNLKRGGMGVHAIELARRVPLQLPQLGGDGSGNGRGVHRAQVATNVMDYMTALRDRMRRVRVCCGDWRRILGPSPTTCIGVTAVFLDPPYDHAVGRSRAIYTHDAGGVAAAVRAWAVEQGNDPRLRIALCGYAGEHQMPDDWSEVGWKSHGGYGNQANGRGRSNSRRERIWFSPYCLPVWT